MPLSCLNPFVRYAKEHKHFSIGKQFNMNYDCRLFYIKSGVGYLETSDGIYNLNDDTAVYMPPRMKYRLSFQHTGQPWNVLIFDFDLIDQFAHIENSLGTTDYRFFEYDRSPDYPVFEEFSQVIVEKSPNLYEQLHKSTDRFLMGTPYHREFTSATIKVALLNLLYAQHDSDSLHILKQIKDYIHENYHKSDLTNEHIANLFGYHPYYLSQLFKEHTGITMHNYLLSYRLRMAKNHLVTTNQSINTIAWQCGFNSCSYFIKQFRSHTGMTPREFRNKEADHLM